MTDAPATREHPWPVGLLSSKLKEYLDRLGTVWVEGEITQWGVSGGNVYGKLKDLEADATISFTMWSSVRARLSEQFKQGDHAVLLVKPAWWVKGGTLSMQWTPEREGNWLFHCHIMSHVSPDRRIGVPHGAHGDHGQHPAATPDGEDEQQHCEQRDEDQQVDGP